MSFSLANNLEAKVVAKNDTVSSEEQYEKIKLIDNLSFSGSYNFVRDSLKLSNISIRGRTTVKGINVSFGGTLNPYLTDTLGRDINRYAWNHKSGFAKLGRLTNANLSFGMSFKSKQKEDQQEGEEPSDIVPFVHPNGSVEYVDFSIPWDFRFDYSFSYSKPNPFRDSRINQSLNFSGRMSLTDNWNLSLTSNFDVQAGKFSFTTFNIQRQLHCWNMSFNFVPFGQRKSYSFTLSASSSMLKDLKVDKKRSWFDN